MRRGEIRLVDLDPVRGAAASKTRPAVIVSSDGANVTATRLGRAVVAMVPALLMTQLDEALRLHLSL
jgi:mRNA interferase MazF